MLGRVVHYRGLGEDLLARWDAWSALFDPAIARAVPAHDLSRFEEYVGFDGHFRVAIGLVLATRYADDGPSAPLDADGFDRDRARADELLTPRTLDRIAADLASDAAWSLRTQRTRALLVPFGPIASARLARGRLVSVLEPIAAGAIRIRGVDMRQQLHDLAIDGELVTAASDWDIAEPDLEASAARGDLHLIARYG